MGLKCRVSLLAGLLDDQRTQPGLPVWIELVHELFLPGGSIVRTDSALVGACVPECSWGHGRMGEGGHVRREVVRVGHAVALAGDGSVLQREALGHRRQHELAVLLHEVRHSGSEAAVVGIIWKQQQKG